MVPSKKSKEKDVQPVEIRRLEIVSTTVGILGKTPIIINRQSQKTIRELTLPEIKSRAGRAQKIKHDPLAEYQASVYTLPEESAPTYLSCLSAWFKSAMKTAALHTPETSKAEVGRLVWVAGERLPLYGIPQMMMATVR